MMMRRKLVLLLITALIVFVAVLPWAAAGDEALFTDLDLPIPQSERDSVQAKIVAVNWGALRNGRSQSIKINLFNGREIIGIRDRLDPSSADDGYVWVGHVQGEPHSSITLSVVDDVIVGSINLLDSNHYSIKYRDGSQILSQIDSTAQKEVEGPDTIEVPIQPQQPAAPQDLCEDGSVIDILVAYTPAARDMEGGTAAIQALINQRISDMNTANNSSGLAFYLPAGAYNAKQLCRNRQCNYRSAPFAQH